MADDVQILAGADPAAAEFIKKDADAYLAAQLTVALAGNQRAMTFFGFLATASALVGGASVSALASDRVPAALGVIGLLVMSGFLVAMALANMAAMPDGFDYVGNTPENWVEDIASEQSFGLSKAQALMDSARCITRNDKVLKRSARYTRQAVWTAWGTLVAGAFVTAVTLGVTYP